MERIGFVCTEIGKLAAKLHSNGIVHGDLTTSNMIVRKDRIVLVDFGLGEISSKLEDKAVDLLALKKTFFATHHGISGSWKAIEEAYCSDYDEGKMVLGQVAAVEARARYY